MDYMKNYLNKELQIFYFILLFVFVPFFSGHERFLLPVLFSLVCILLYNSKINIIKAFHNKDIKIILYLFILHSFLILSGLLVNTKEFNSIRPFFEVFKYLGFFIIILFSYLSILNSKNTINIIMNKGIFFLKIILVLQVFIMFDQLLEINLLSNIYSYSKSNPNTMRLVGTLYNPNTFGWIILQFGVLIFLFDKSKFKLLWLILVAFMVLFSGSKSNIIMMFFDIFLLYFFINNYSVNSIKFFKIITIFFISLLIFILMIYFFKDIFISVSVLYDLITQGPSSLTTLSARFKIWESGLDIFFNTESLMNILFGYSNIFRNLDNNYFFILIRYGLVGCLAYILLFIYILKISYTYKDTKIGLFLLQFIILQLILGLQADNLAGWIYPIFLYLFLGILIAYKERLR